VAAAGGVVANLYLRQSLINMFKKHQPSKQLFLPPLRLATDNAVMIAAAAYFKTRQKKFASWRKLEADPNLEIGGLI